MLLYIILCILLAYIMLFVCIMHVFSYSLAIDISKCLLSSCFVLVYRHIASLFQVLFCIMLSDAIIILIIYIIYIYISY